jgi:hypothetical protein
MASLLFANLLVAGLAAGGFVFMNLVVGRALTLLAGLAYAESHRALVPTASPYMTVLTLLATASTLAVAVASALRGDGAGAVCAAAGTLLALAVIGISVGINVPINQRVARWPLPELPPDWAAVRARWIRFHALRTWVSVAAFGCSVAAAAVAG